MQQDFYHRLVAGEQFDCPCCGRYAQLYKRRLHTSICLQLVKLYKLGGADQYVHASKLIPRGVTGTGDFTKAKYWSLIEEFSDPANTGKSSGLWALTSVGVEFVRNEIGVAEWALVYDDKVLRYEGNPITISEAVKNKFNYEELMEAA